MSWYDDEASVILSAGPVRVNTSDPDPDFEPRPVGFVQKRGRVEPRTDEQIAGDRLMAEVVARLARPPMPLLWEGDQA